MNPVIYAACDCTVWPLVTTAPVGSCGRCGAQPHTPASRSDRARFVKTGLLPWQS